MKLLSETYKELGIDFRFPIEIKDANGNWTYHENSDGWWVRWEFDAHGKPTYFEDSKDYWAKWERDADGNRTYFENSRGRKEGTPRLAKTCEGKVVEFGGIKFELTAL